MKVEKLLTLFFCLSLFFSEPKKERKRQKKRKGKDCRMLTHTSKIKKSMFRCHVQTNFVLIFE
jgi:hypothetical protein